VPCHTPQLGFYALWDHRFPRRVALERTPRLYETLVDVLRHPHNWVDRRHLTPLTGLVVGLLPAGTSRLTAWAPSVHRRAAYAQSPVRRCARWLEHDRIDGHARYGPLLPQARAEWGTHGRYLALDPSPWWQPDGLVRRALV
jgi:hypothetical protein